MSSVLLLLGLGLLMAAAQQFSPAAATGSAPSATTLAFGYLLLTAFFAGTLCKRIGLPRLTGYLAAGMVIGPEVLGLVSAEVVDNLRIANGVAVALIALTAGSEMHLQSMRPLLRSIGWITGLAVMGTAVLLFVVLLVLSPVLPFMAALDTSAQVAAAAAVMAVVLVAQSPAVVVALRDDTGAQGPLTNTILGAVVLADIVVIVAFGVVSALARIPFGSEADIVHTVRLLAWEIGGSAVTGIVVGIGLWAYLRHVASGGALFVLVLAFIIAEVGQPLHFDPLLVALVAGMFIRNATGLADRLHHEIASASLPVYVVFFGVAGATIHVHALATVGPVAAVLVAVRGLGFWGGTRMAARRAGAPEVVARWGAFGLLPQAGLALALALILTRAFPELGQQAATLVFGVVAINELVAPILLRRALIKSGEAAGNGSSGHAGDDPPDQARLTAPSAD
jgi:Kef-type K+ transport system membrane component KefB